MEALVVIVNRNRQHLFRGLLPIEWVIFRNLDVIPVFDDDTLADRWAWLRDGDECARRSD
jgi:hypothetical protein